MSKITHVLSQNIPLIPDSELFVCAIKDKNSILIVNWRDETIISQIENVY